MALLWGQTLSMLPFLGRFLLVLSLLLFAFLGILGPLAEADCLLVGFGLELDQPRLAAHQRKLLLIGRAAGRQHQALYCVAGQHVDFHLPEVGFVEEFDQAIGEIAVVASDLFGVFDEYRPEKLADGPEVHVAQHFFGELLEAV